MRGPRGAWRFSFRDLIVLRTAQALVDAKVPARRITRSMRELRRHLPESMPLSGLRIGALADRVVVTEGDNRWQADSGQYVLEFEADPANGALTVIEPAKARDAAIGAQDWFARAAALEAQDAEGALRAYEEAVIADPSFLDAYINWGRLLHDGARFARAERVYRAAIDACGPHPVLYYNLAVLLEDMARSPAAIAAYEAALRGDPHMADCHYNLALLYEKLAKPKDALRHMARYRKLTASRAQ